MQTSRIITPVLVSLFFISCGSSDIRIDKRYPMPSLPKDTPVVIILDTNSSGYGRKYTRQNGYSFVGTMSYTCDWDMVDTRNLNAQCDLAPIK